MKELFRILEKDILKDGFRTRDYIVYGIVAPVAFFGLCLVVEMVAQMVK